MTFGNEPALEASLQRFVRFARSDSYSVQERDYKVETLNSLGQVLTETALASSDFRITLRDTVRAHIRDLDNLTHYTNRDDLLKYLERADTKRVRSLLRALLYGQGDLATRIDIFKQEIDADYEKHLSQKKHISLGMISLLLAACFPEKYIIYRWEPIKAAAERWGMPVPDGNGANRYVACLDWLKPIQTRLTLALGRPADLIDVHSLLWEAYPGSGYEHKPETTQMDTQATLSRIISLLMDMTSAPRTRNIILYGPPGTGKTYWVREFARYFLSNQLNSPMPQGPYLDPDWGLRWQDVIALAMYNQDPNGQFVPGALKDDVWVKEYFARQTHSQDIARSIVSTIPFYSIPDESVKRTRIAPYLFQRYAPGKWGLSQEGREYVETALAVPLAACKNPQPRIRQLADFCAFVTFHQSFAYEEFVEGLKPSVDEEEQVCYKVEGGVFRRICQQAERDPNNKYLLVIDEINRANIAKVFGELITLIEDDKRMKWDAQAQAWKGGIRVRLPYTHAVAPDAPEFGVPSNLYLLGTMNTADRSIALLDLALRRRFTFVELMPDPALLAPVAGINLEALLTRLNRRITALLDRDHQIGHSYLLDLKDTEGLRFAWYCRVVPLLQEYFYNDGERLTAVLGRAFVEEEKPPAGLFESAPESFDADRSHFKIRTFDGDDEEFLQALAQLSGAPLLQDQVDQDLDDSEGAVLTREEFMRKCEKPVVRAFYERVLDRAQRAGVNINWNKRSFSLRARFPGQDYDFTFVYCYYSGNFDFYFWDGKMRSKKIEPELRKKLLTLSVFQESGDWTLRAPLTETNLKQMDQVCDFILDEVGRLVKV